MRSLLRQISDEAIAFAHLGKVAYLRLVALFCPHSVLLSFLWSLMSGLYRVPASGMARWLVWRILVGQASEISSDSQCDRVTSCRLLPVSSCCRYGSRCILEPLAQESSVGCRFAASDEDKRERDWAVGSICTDGQFPR